MKKHFVKSLPEYEEAEFEPEKIIEAMIRHSGGKKKKPTSVALDEDTIKTLKKKAKSIGLPYQVLMRLLIIDGLSRIK